MKFPRIVAFWIVLCALLNCAGWILSALHQLNRTGYLCAFALIGAFLCTCFKRGTSTGTPCRVTLQKYRRRFTRKFPLAFLILAVMALAGGVIYAPTNYDALAYRIPRILHWLAEGRWHWIHTEFQRLNTRAVGIEWVSVPIIAFTRTDRFLFVINAVSFLLLPGLVFGVLTRLGIRARAAWHWMWLIPTGYCYLLQAGSIGNDLFGAVFGLAALDFALRARKSRQATDVWLSALAATLLTGAKISNLPLLLPWLVAVFPALPALFPRPLATLAVTIAALFSSFVPMGLLNFKHCGDWTGQAAEQTQMNKGSVLLYIPTNAILFTIHNLKPPIFPAAKWWNAMVPKVVPTKFTRKLEDLFETSGAHFSLGEMQTEEDSGVGFGVTVLSLVSATAGCFMRKTPTFRQRDAFSSNVSRWAIPLSACIALLVYMSKSGMGGTTVRIIAPYYAFLIPLLLGGSCQAKIVNFRWWKWCASVVYLLAAVLLVVSPARPLWPANFFFSRLDANTFQNRLLLRAKTVYSVYGERADGFAPVRNILPAGVHAFGLISFDDPEAALWWPLGSRRMEHLVPSDTSDDIRRHGIQYILINSDKLPGLFGLSLEEWLTKYHAETVKTVSLKLRASDPAVDWVLVKLQVQK